MNSIERMCINPSQQWLWRSCVKWDGEQGVPADSWDICSCIQDDHDERKVFFIALFSRSRLKNYFPPQFHETN
jgi:hypothetical protein